MKYAKESNMPYVNNRWLGGMLTNFNTVKKSISKLDDLKKQLDMEHTNNLTKKESLKIKKLIAKLNKNLEGIKDLLGSGAQVEGFNRQTYSENYEKDDEGQKILNPIFSIEYPDEWSTPDYNYGWYW